MVLIVGWVLSAVLLLPIQSLAAPAVVNPRDNEPRAAAPTVKLDAATFTGFKEGSTNKFLGIPFAKPPTGNLRFRRPVPVDPYTGSRTATAYGPACPQQAPRLPLSPGLVDEVVDALVESIFNIVFPDDEDCLSVNVVTPATATPTSKLPVVVWIFGGGFQLGNTGLYDGGIIVDRGVDVGLPVVYVSINYRVSAFGFLGGKEVKAAGVGNLGLQDQREALRWVQKYIGAFGGDPSKVTIWGESAGAISVGLQMVANGGNHEGLFRGAFMQSGSPIPVGDISNGQEAYDRLVNSVGCTGTSDTLQCLRGVPYSKLKAVANDSPGIFDYSSLSLTWLPRVDGVFLTENPMLSVKNGKVANVPYITGDLDDEGSLFALGTLNITTDAQFKTWAHRYFLRGATESEVNQVMSLYPSSPSAGSPYDTGILNSLTPQSKRIASFQGDITFQVPRRVFLENTASKQNTWAYLSKRLKGTPVLGSFHASDILNVYGSGELKDYLLRFAVNLDPNVGPWDFDLISWPKWTASSKSMLLLEDGIFFDIDTTKDDFRIEPMKYLAELSLKYPL